MDARNQYVGTDIKWIIAQSINGGEWIIKTLGSSDAGPDFINSETEAYTRAIDECPAYIRDDSEFAIFRNRLNWFTHKPRRLIDFRDKSNAKICGLSGLINSLSSDWF